MTFNEKAFLAGYFLATGEKRPQGNEKGIKRKLEKAYRDFFTKNYKVR